MAVRIWLLGGFRVSVGSGTIAVGAWRLKKAASLVKLLALAPGHRLHREQAMDLLWPEQGRRAAANNLRGALHAARKVIDPAMGSHYLASEDESLALCPRGNLWVDAEAFEEAAAAARRSRDPGAYRAALELYAGALLPGDRYEEWAEGRRQELRHKWLSLHIELARAYEERGEHERGIAVLQRAVSEEPTDEEMHAGLMRLYALSGRRGDALAQYERLREALSGRLDSEVGVPTRRLREDIAAGRLLPSEPTVPPTVAPTEGPSDAGKHNLPASRTSFVGREHEMLGIKRKLAMTRLLTLTGVGGSGKTRLALEVARDLVGAYPDGVRLAELASLSKGEFVAQSVAEAVGVQDQPGRLLTDTLVDALRTKKVLLILDNCEHLIDAAGGLVALLLDSCPRLRVLATSRESLGAIGEVIWPVPLLSAPDLQSSPTVAELEGYEAVRLFLDRARQRDPSFALGPENAQAVARICARLEGLPLAIELAAARIRILPPRALLDRLSDRLKLLTDGPRELSERQRTLRGTIGWSYGLLNEEEKVLFAKLSVFSGGGTLEAAEAVCEAPEDPSVDVLGVASSLLDKSLIRQVGAGGEPRFVMLETLREYARERLEESGKAETTRRAHAEYFLTLAEEAEPRLWGPEDAEWLERLGQEHDNLRAALSWAMEREEIELALRLGGALRWFWSMRGHYIEGRSWLEAALARDGGASAQARAKALEGVSWLSERLGDLDRLEATVGEGLKLSAEAELGDVVAAEFHNLLGGAAEARGDHMRAMQMFEEGLALNRRAQNKRGIAFSLGMMAMTLTSQGHTKRGKVLWEEVLPMSRELGGSEWLVVSLTQLGWELLLEGEPARAAALSEEAAELCRKRGRRSLLQGALDNLGWAALIMGDRHKAEALLQESLVLCKELGDQAHATNSLDGLACYAGVEGETERAAKLFGAAEALREASGYWEDPRDRSLREPYLESARSRSEGKEWEAAFAEGQSMTVDEAVEYALSAQASPAPPSNLPQQGPADWPLATLTRREKEVATLLAQGLTNGQIAKELFISERTVDHHVEKVLKKLELTSREQVASRLAE